MNNKIIFIILLCIVSVNDVLGDINLTVCDPVEISFQLCNSSALCRTRMYIDENGDDDITTFTFLYTSLVTKNSFQPKIESWICNQTSNDLLTLPATEPFELLWIEFMARFSYCGHVNEYFDNIQLTCICRSDKFCKYLHPRDIESHITEFVIPVGLLIIFVVAITAMVFQMKNLKLDYEGMHKLFIQI